jgi:hypothetical protein
MVLVTLLLSACQASAAAATPQPPFKPGDAPSALIDDFESTNSAWEAGRWPLFTDSSATTATPAAQHATRGRQSLQLSFDALALPKAIFLLRRDMDLSDAQALAFDLYNTEGAAASVALVLTGAAGAWQESQPLPLKPGANAVTFGLSTTLFKTAATRWKYTAHVSPRAAIQQMALVLEPLKSGGVFIDKLLSVQAAQPIAPATSANTPTPHLSIQAPPAQLKQYDHLELNLSTDMQVDNPFDPQQMRIDVTFSDPQGRQITVPAYFNQDFTPGAQKPVWPQTWKARFTPTREGAWTARAQLTSARTQYTSAPVRFEVTPGVSRGMLRVDADNARYLAFDNGEAFLPSGINLGWGHERPLDDYRRWLDALKQNGANVTRIWMASWAFGIEWSDSGLGRYRLDRAWLLDQVLQMAEERGIYVILVLINHGAFNITVNPEWASNPYNKALGGPCAAPEDFATHPQARALFKQRLRYIAARWAYSPNLLAWEWWNEVNFTPLSDPNLLRPWLQEMTAYLRSVDPYQHLASISYSDANDPRITRLPEISFLQRHAYNNADPRPLMVRAYAELTGYGTQALTKPVLFTEFGASADGERPTRFDPEGMQFHNGLWAAPFSGFASTALYWWWDNYIEANNYWGHLKGISAFLAGEDVARYGLAAAQANTSTVVVAALARQDAALLWLRNAQYSVEAAQSAYRQATLFGGVKEADWRLTFDERRNITATLDGLQAGAYRVTWYDTRSGAVLAQQTTRLRVGESKLTISAPSFTRDVAAKVIRVSG